jgi:RNA polymerase sigma-70 factor (ECF subfamily)
MMDSFEKKNIEKLKKGDIRTLEYIYHMYSLNLVRYAFQFVNDEERAKDVVQEVFYKLWRDRESLHVEVSLEAFLYTCVKNECLNYLKHLKIRRRYASVQKRFREMEIRYYENKIDRNIRMEELQEKIHKVLDALPDKTRAVFKMSRFENKKNKEIAQELAISLKAVEKHITKALKHLRESIQP